MVMMVLKSDDDGDDAAAHDHDDGDHGNGDQGDDAHRVVDVGCVEAYLHEGVQ